MIWKKLTVDTSVEVEDLISEFLNENGAEGVLIEDNVPLTDDELKEMFVDVPLMSEDDGKASVSCFLRSEEAAEELSRLLKEELKRLSEFLPVGTGEIHISDTTDDTTWNDKWKDFFKPFRLYDDIVIQPVWTEYDDIRENDKIIKIESVMAFGTGTHETTKLCLGQLRKYIAEKKEPTVFDIGCGSGILSIAAVLFGAGYVHGLDIDPQAVDSSKINAAANGLSSDRIDFSTGNLLNENYISLNAKKKEEFDKYKKGSLGSGIASPLTPAEMVDFSLGGEDSIPKRRYDIVVANILADVIIPLCPVVRDYMNEDGIFITSGIIDTKAEDVKAAMIEAGYEILDELKLNEWVSIVAR